MFDSWVFWVALLAVAAVAQLLPARAARARALLLAAASLAVAHSLFGLTASQLAFLLGALTWLLVGIRLTGSLRARHPWLTALLLCGPLLAAWVFGKQSLGVGTAVGAGAVLLGISYVMVKAYTLAKDVADGRVGDVDLPTGYAYFLFFPTYVAGPMHYYTEFRQTLCEPEPLTGQAAVGAAFRFLLGMVKTQVLVPLLQPMSLLALRDGAGVPPTTLAASSVVFSFVLLFDFSGYSDMAIATARLVGVRTPENFRFPYLAQNPRDFWQRWHITFSRVLTGYIFVPLTRALQRRLGRRRALISATGYVGTFVLAGYWHGAAANFLLWGLYHAAGLFVYDQYRAARPPARRLAAHRGSAEASGARPAWRGLAWRRVAWRGLAIAATFLFVSLGWILFVLPVERLTTVVS